MKYRVPLLSGLTFVALLASTAPLTAQESPPEKVKKHYEMLLKRPAPGYLFDRFFNGWLDSATLDDLEKFLTARAAAEGTTANHLLLAYFHARQGDSVKAIGQFRVALEKDPGSADAWYQKAVVEARTLNFDTALSDLEKAAASKPREDLELTVRQLQARLLIRSGKPDKATAVFKALVAAHPASEELREDIIELLVTEGLMDDAAASARELIELTKDPQKKVLRRLRLGDILQRSGKREEAVDIYAATLAETGSDSWLEKEIISQIEQVFRREDDLGGLRERLKTMIAAEPRRLALRLAQARMMTSEEQTDAALKAWQEILDLTPGNRALRETYIEQMAALKKLPEAITQMKELVARHATDLELLPRLADLYFQNKQRDDCRATILQFVDKSDQKLEGPWLRGAAMMERYSLSPDALALLTKAAAALPDSEGIAEAQAVTLHGMDKKEEAVAVWKKLAAGKNRERTLQVARLASARSEMQAAFDILHARLKDFENDPLFLAELVSSAVKVKKETDALPWARRRIALTANAVDLEPALDDAVRIIAALEKEQEVIGSIGAEATPQELSLAAALQESLGNPKKAEELLGKITAVKPELGGSLQVRLFVTRGEPLKAAEAMKKVVELPDGRKTASVQRLVELYQRAGRLDDALFWAAEWKRLSPGAVQPWDTEAQLLTLAGRTGEALKALRQASQMFPDNEDLKAGLARRYRDDGRIADAQRILEQLYEDGKDPGAKLRWVSEMAQTAELQGRTKELVESFEERRRTNRGSTLPLLALSEIYRTSGSYEERRAALLEAARLKPEDVDLLMEIARIEQSQGELTAALETLKKARPLDKSNRAIQKIAEVLFTLGKDDEAVTMMGEIDTAKRLDPAAIESLAMSVITSGEWERAESFLLPLLAKYPDNYRLLYLHAITLEETARNDEARDAFLRLLKMQKEMQGARPGKQREYFITLRRHVPDTTVQLMELMNGSNSGYTHRQRRGSGGYYTTVNGTTTYVGNNGTPQAPYLPSEISEMRTLSLVHLTNLAQSMDEPSVAALKKELISRGYPWAEFLTDLNKRVSYNGNVSPQILNIVKAAPHQEYALALLTLNMSYSPAGRQAPEMREAYALFKDKYPQLAAMAFLSLLRHDDEADMPLLKEGAAFITSIEQPIDTLSYSLSNVSWMATGENTTLKPGRREIAKTILDKLESMYASLPSTSPARAQLQNSIFNACVNRKDWPRVIGMLEQELADARASSTQAMAQGNYYYNDSFIAEPPFPPRRLPQIPPAVARRWGLDDYGNNLYLNVPPEETENFKKAVRAAKEPTVRILLAQKYGDEATVEEMLKAAAALPEPDAAVCTILAGWYSGKNEPDKALEWLRRTQFLPLTRDDRAVIDRYLLGIITLSGLNPAPDSPDFTAARDAVVRLRQTRLDNQKREAMAMALNALGLVEDAEKLTAANTANPSSSSPGGSRNNPGTVGQLTADARVEQFLKQGQKEKAMALLMREFRSTARAIASGGSSGDASGLVRVAIRQNLKEEVLRQMKPAEGAVAGLAEYGWLCTAFDNKEEGRMWTEKAVAVKPRDLALRAGAVAAYLNAEKPDLEAAWKLLEAAPVDSFMLMENQSSRIFPYSQRLDSQMNNLEIVRRLLEKLKDTPDMEWSWLMNTLEYCVRGGNQDNVSLPSLYMTTTEESTSLTRASKIKELEGKRRTLHDAVCQVMMEIPVLREQGFTRYASLRLRDNKDGDDLVQMAKKVMTAKSDASQDRYSSRYSYNSGYYGYDDGSGTRLTMKSAEDYLADTALKTNNRALLEEVAAELEKQDRAPVAKSLRARAELYFCPESEFEALARAQILTNKPEDRLVPDNVIVQIWQKRKLPPVLTGILVERLKSPEAQKTGIFQIPPDYPAALVTAGRKEDAAALMRDICAAVLGPVEQRGDFLRRNWNPRGYSPQGTPGFMIRNLRQMFTMFSSKDELAFLANEVINEEMFRHAEETRRDDYYGNNMRLDRVAQNWTSTKPERIKAILSGSRLLSDLPDWRPGINAEIKTSTVLPGILRSYLQNRLSEPKKKEHLELLKAYPASFGRDLLIAAASAEKDDEMRRAVLDLLGTRKAALEPLPAERLAEIASFAADMAGSDTAKLKLAPETTALLEWLKPKRPESDDLASFLKPAAKWDKPVRLEEWQPKLQNALAQGAKESREKFLTVVARARATRLQGLPGPLASGPKQDNSPLAAAIAQYIRGASSARRELKTEGAWNSLLYAADATLDPANDLDWDANAIEAEVTASFHNLWRDCDEKKDSRKAVMDDFAARLENIFTEEQFRLYAQSFVSILRLTPKNGGMSRQEMKEWVATPAAKAGPVARTCALLMSMDAARDIPPEPAEVKAYEDYVLALARDTKIPVKTRLSMTAVWLNQGRKTLPPEVCREAATMLADAWQARRAWNIWDAANIVRAVLELPDAALRGQLLKPIAAAASRVYFVHLDSRLDEEMVAVAVQCGDRALLDRVAATRNGRPHNGFLAAMLQEGVTEEARRWFDQSALTIDTKSSQDFAPWTAGMAKNAEAFAQSLDAPHKGYLAEILISLLPVSDDYKANTEHTRERLIPLAKKFGTIPLPDSAWRDRVIELLSRDEKAIVEAARFFGPSTEKDSLGALARVQGQMPASKLKMLQLWTVREFTEKRFGPLEQFLGDLSVRRIQSNYYSSRGDGDAWTVTIRETIRQTAMAAFKESHTWTPEERAKLGEIYRTALGQKTYTDGAEVEDVIQATLLYHAATGQMAELQAWWKTVPEDQQKKIRERFWNQNVELWPNKDDLKERYGDDRAARVLFVKEYLANPVGVNGGENSMERPAEMEWVTRAEILAMADELIQREPRSTDTMRQLALVAERERAWERCAALLASASEHLDKEGLKLRTGLLLRRARVLLEADKPADALKQTEDLQPLILEPFKDGKVDTEALSRLATWIDTRGEALFAVDRHADALAFLGINPSVQKLAAKESGGNVGDSSLQESIFRYYQAKTGIKISTLVAKGSTWKYQDAEEPPPSKWAAPDFDDKDWQSGPARLGYGDPVKTQMSYGADEKKKPMATYFRTTFDIADAKTISSLHLGIQRDDGCVVYLNGHEVARQNMPDGPVDHTTAASSAVDQGAEYEFFPAILTPEHLVSGKNVLAVEVHQVKATSTDLSFNLQLRSNLPDPAEVMRSLNPAEIGPKLGDLWTALPEPLRKALE